MSKSILVIIVLSFFSFSSCNQKTSTETSIEDIQRKELEIKTSNHEELESLISTIEFEVKATPEELKDWEEGKIPWISIADAENQIQRLISADEIVIHNSEIEINIDYPLNKPFKFKVTNQKGFTRKQLIEAISKKYKEIYAEEELTAKTKTIPLNQRKGIVNRNQTDGKYEIWGHDIEDLDISSIEVYKTNENKIQLVLGIES